MHAAFFRQPGPPDVVEYGDLPEPVCQPDQVLLRTAAVSVNPIDVYIRAGWVDNPAPRPTIIGSEASGTIAAVGSQVRGFRAGDRVWTMTQGMLGRQGTFAQLIAVDPGTVYRLPGKVSFADAAACGLVGVTAHLGLIQRAGILPGQTLCILGASGAVGLVLIQIAKQAQARVIALAGSGDKCKRCLEFGADETINYREPDLADRLRRLAPAGVDVIWTTSREPDFDFLVGALAERGTIVLMAGREARPPFPTGPFYVKQCRMIGVVMFKGTPAELQIAADAVGDMLAAGQLRAPIAVRMPLSQARQAHQLQESATVERSTDLSGKIVLEPDAG
jgi:NADPH2:quinone reductase